MAKDKKSFVLYTDQFGIFDKLTDEQAGVLIKHIFKYCNDENPNGDFVTELAFESIKQQLKRDLKKYEQIKEKRSEAGKISAEKRKQQKSTKSTNVKCVEQTLTKSTVTVNDNVNDNVINNIYRKFKHLSITKEDTKKLYELGYTREQIDNTLDAIENYKNNKNYTSLYLTARKWLQKETPQRKKDVKKMNEVEKGQHLIDIMRINRNY